MLSFKQYTETQKVLYIIRGISGSGKSTQAKKIKAKEGGVIYSTDEFFYDQEGNYNWTQEDLIPNHQKNIKRAYRAMQQGLSPVIIDNTNLKYSPDAEPYVKIARKFGYEIKVVEPNTPWAFNAKELAKRNSHGTPEDVIQKMISDYESPETFTRQISPIQNYG